MLPNFDKLPSVMSFEQVEIQFELILDYVNQNPSVDINLIADVFDDGIFSLEYNPKGRFSNAVCERIFNWIKQNWLKGGEEFIDGATAILCNIHCDGIYEFLVEIRKTDKRPFIDEFVKEALLERRCYPPHKAE